MNNTVGVLALQGAYQKHVDSLEKLGVKSRLIRKAGELDNCDALILPGGESTTISLLLHEYALYEPIIKFAEFMVRKRKWKMLNKLFVSGTINRGFFRKSKDFELVIYFSGLKKLIFEVYSDDINLKDPKLGIDFGVGDNWLQAH